MVNDHTRSAENWKCVWYLLRLYIYVCRVYVDSHSLGQLALASKRTASTAKSESLDIFSPANFDLRKDPRTILQRQISKLPSFKQEYAER